MQKFDSEKSCSYEIGNLWNSWQIVLSWTAFTYLKLALYFVWQAVLTTELISMVYDLTVSQAIFEAASVHCLDIGMQCHGCCVLQRCIARSRGEHREKLVAAIARNGFELAQDAYG